MTDAEMQDFVTKSAAAWGARDSQAFLDLWQGRYRNHQRASFPRSSAGPAGGGAPGSWDTPHVGPDSDAFPVSDAALLHRAEAWRL